MRLADARVPRVDAREVRAADRRHRVVERLRVEAGGERRDDARLEPAARDRVVERREDLPRRPAARVGVGVGARLRGGLHVRDLRHAREDERHADPRPRGQPQPEERRLRHDREQRVQQHGERRQHRRQQLPLRDGLRHRRQVGVVVGRRLLGQRAQRLQDRRAERREEALPHERPPLVEARGGRREGRLVGREQRRRKVVAVDVVPVVVGVLVVREQVLRDPHEDVEADRVARELQPVVDARVGREVAVRRLVHRVRNQHPVHKRQQQAGERRALEPAGPARGGAERREPDARPVRRRRLGRRRVAELGAQHAGEVVSQRRINRRQRRRLGRLAKGEDVLALQRALGSKLRGVQPGRRRLPQRGRLEARQPGQSGRGRLLVAHVDGTEERRDVAATRVLEQPAPARVRVGIVAQVVP